MAEPSFLHPRAVRMGLERVIEHQRVNLNETALLSQVYTQVLQAAEPLDPPLNPQQLADFLARDSKAEREDWIQSFLKPGL
jgi:hypothetical protein